MIILLLIFNLTWSLSWGQDKPEEVKAFVEAHPHFYYVYQHPLNEEQNLLSEVLLIESLKWLPKSIYKNLKKDTQYFKDIESMWDDYFSSYPEISAEDILVGEWVDEQDASILEEFPFAIEGKKAPFKVKNLRQMFEQIIREEERNGLTIQLGDEPKWSQEFREHFSKQYPYSRYFSKILICLMKGVCSRFLPTGLENEMELYILSQENKSVTLDKIFRTGLRLNKGNVFNALLTIENVLSRYWKVPGRENLLITHKLADISNFHYKTDKFGQWYHFFGIMLYGYVRGGFTSTFVGNVESFGSLIMNKEESEKQENIINRKGGRVGAQLSKSIQKKLYQKRETDPKFLDENYYLQIDEDFSKAINKMIKKVENENNSKN